MNTKTFTTGLSMISLWLTACITFAEEKQPQTYKLETDLLYRSEVGLDEYQQERCRLDVYVPENQQGFATVVWFHGGGLTGGNKSIPEGLKHRGIAVVAANYRLSPKVSSPTYIEDAAAAVAWTFQHIEKYGGSKKRVYVSGHSAGGYLTNMVGLDKRRLAEERCRQVGLGCISCSIDIDATIQIVDIIRHHRFQKLAIGGCL